MLKKQVYFISSCLQQGSTILRGNQIIDGLKDKINAECNIIPIEELYKFYNQSNNIFIWIGFCKSGCNESGGLLTIANEKTFISNNIHIIDLVDKFVNYTLDSVNNLKLYDKIIVNSKFMLKYIEENFNCANKCFIIYANWDKRLTNTITYTNNELIFGYIGSIKSLLYHNNFLHYDKLVKEYNIEFYDTEIGRYVTNNVKNNNINYPVKYEINNMPQKVNFNCDISIRINNSSESMFKDTGKLATAAALNHNIITTYEHAVRDNLPPEYPFILKDTDINTIRDMFNKIIKDYNGNKELWNKGLEIMKIVKSNLTFENIILKYIELLNIYL